MRQVKELTEFILRAIDAPDEDEGVAADAREYATAFAQRKVRKLADMKHVKGTELVSSAVRVRLSQCVCR